MRRYLSPTVVGRMMVFSVLLFANHRAGADALLYSVTDLGAVNPGANYLNGLSPSDQTAFRSSSFDRSAHPAPAGAYLGGYYDSEGNSVWHTSHGWHLASDPVVSNNLGQIAGQAEVNGGGTTAFFYDPRQPASSWQGSAPGVGRLSDVVSTDVGANARANGINDRGQVVGSIQTDSGIYNSEAYLAQVRSGNDISSHVTLGFLGRGQGSEALALNNSGQVVGWSYINPGDGFTANIVQHAFLYESGMMEDLNRLIPATSGLVLNQAVGVDDGGRIVAYGTDQLGGTHAYLLSPAAIPEPGTLTIAGLLIAVGAAIRRRSRRD